jgi:biopolymer transport protein ExbD
MAFGTQDDTDDVMNEINMTPLVDVMLVLLIIFIITVPVMKHAVNIDLPRASSEREQTKPENILFSVAADGSYYWNEQKITDAEFASRLATESAKDPQPELHIRGDKEVRYERVAQAMSLAREAGVRKIGFITEPNTK